MYTWYAHQIGVMGENKSWFNWQNAKVLKSDIENTLNKISDFDQREEQLRQELHTITLDKSIANNKWKSIIQLSDELQNVYASRFMLVKCLNQSAHDCYYTDVMEGQDQVVHIQNEYKSQTDSGYLYYQEILEQHGLPADVVNEIIGPYTFVGHIIGVARKKRKGSQQSSIYSNIPV